MRQRAQSAIWCCALASVLGACSSGPKQPEQHVADVNGVRFVQSSELDATRPIALGAQVGLEHHAWLTDDTGGRVGRVLAAYAQAPVPIDASALDRLRRCGFRVVAVPIEQVAAVHAGLPPKLTWRREWAGQLPVWTELLRGRSIEEGQRLLVDGVEHILPAGTPRFIARTWAAPTMNGAVLRTEIGVQLHEASRHDPARAVFDPAAALTLPQQGRLIEEASFRADLEPSHALVIVSERDGVDWARLREDSSQDDEAEEGIGKSAPMEETPAFDVLSDDDVIGADVFGPAMQGPQELGVYMMSGLDRSYHPIKAVFVLIPRMPGHYRLLP